MSVVRANFRVLSSSRISLRLLRLRCHHRLVYHAHVPGLRHRPSQAPERGRQPQAGPIRDCRGSAQSPRGVTEIGRPVPKKKLLCAPAPRPLGVGPLCGPMRRWWPRPRSCSRLQPGGPGGVKEKSPGDQGGEQAGMAGGDDGAEDGRDEEGAAEQAAAIAKI